MSLYYELDPANENADPQLPPILKSKKVDKEINVFSKAISSVETNDTGTVFFSDKSDEVDLAILLNPEIKKKRCNQMIYLMMVAVGDAIGALAPPEVLVSYSFPGYIYLNKGEAGIVNFAIDSKTKDDEIPEWLVLGVKLKLKQSENSNEDHPDPEVTSLETEGAGFISKIRMIEAICRHFLAWLNQWEDDGFSPVIKMWNRRLEKNKYILFGEDKLKFILVDEDGEAVVEKNNEKFSLSPIKFFHKIKEINLR